MSAFEGDEGLDIGTTGVFDQEYLEPRQMRRPTYGHVKAGQMDQEQTAAAFPRSGINPVTEQEDRDGEDSSGIFQLHSEFVIMLIDKSVVTKVTTLNRIMSYRVLLYMANGAGLISHGKGRALKAEDAMVKAIIACKRNIIALPMDPRCTLPLAITKRFQDYVIYLRPLPGFNSWGNPVFSLMLSLSGFQHLGFKTIHQNKNMYSLVASFFNAVTLNTTPQELAERKGFKVYRHRFIRPLTQGKTHDPLSQ